MSVESPFQRLLDRVPVRRRTASVAGTDTVWFEYGEHSDRTLVFVHGFRGDHHGLETIAAHLPGYRILIPDLPGFGESAALPHGSGIEGFASWLQAFVAEHASGVPVLGHSFGSIVVAAAAAGGLDASAIILVNPIGAPALKGPKKVLTLAALGYYRLSAALPKRAGEALLGAPPIVRAMSVAMAKSQDPAARRWIHDQHDLYFSRFADRDSLLDAFAVSIGTDVSHFARDVTLPVLLVAADRDDITPLRKQHALRPEFPDAELTVLHDVGHLVHYERPAEAASAIRRWLRARAL